MPYGVSNHVGIDVEGVAEPLHETIDMLVPKRGDDVDVVRRAGNALQRARE